MNRKTVTIISFWIIFIGLFILGHKILSNIIIHYQQMPATETKQAYQLISQYKQSVINFYQQMGRCPDMADKKQIIPTVEAYTYVKIIRFLGDPESKTCFISAQMREDTPSKDVKNQFITLAYKVDQPPTNNWICYTNIKNINTIKYCRGHALPNNFLKALANYKRTIK